MQKSRILWLIGALTVLLAFLAVACEEEEAVPEATPTEEAVTEASPTPRAVAEETVGVTDTEVIIGAHTSLTGPIAAYSIVPKTSDAYFKYINETEGGVNGRKIKFIMADDQYSPPLTVDVTRRLVEQDKIFAMFNGLGTPTHLQVVDYLQEKGVPDMYIATGAVEWVKDPSARPMAFGSNPNYTGEGLVVGKYIADNFAGKKLGIILQNDDFGKDGATGVKLGVGDALEVVGEETYEVTDANLFSQVDRLQAAGADVIAAWATPLLLSTAIKHARQDLNWDVPFFISAVSVNELTMLLTGADVIEGTMGPVATYMAWQTDKPGVARHLEILDRYGVGRENASALSLYSQYVAEMMVEALKRAGPDLTRQGLVEAAESIKSWKCSVCLFPISLSDTDHDPAQIVILARFEGGRIVPFSDGYSYEGVPVDELSVEKLERVPAPE